MSSLCTYALRRAVNPHSQSFFARLTLNNRKAALINCVRHTEWTQSPAAFHRFSPVSTQLVDPPQKTENQSSLHKWLRKSLLFLSCGFGAYVFKSSLHYASCIREDDIKQDMLVCSMLTIIQIYCSFLSWCLTIMIICMLGFVHNYHH